GRPASAGTNSWGLRMTIATSAQAVQAAMARGLGCRRGEGARDATSGAGIGAGGAPAPRLRHTGLPPPGAPFSMKASAMSFVVCAVGVWVRSLTRAAPVRLLIWRARHQRMAAALAFALCGCGASRPTYDFDAEWKAAGTYAVGAGDVLQVRAWKNETLSQRVT